MVNQRPIHSDTSPDEFRFTLNSFWSGSRYRFHKDKYWENACHRKRSTPPGRRPENISHARPYYPHLFAFCTSHNACHEFTIRFDKSFSWVIKDLKEICFTGEFQCSRGKWPLNKAVLHVLEKEDRERQVRWRIYVSFPAESLIRTVQDWLT